MCAGARRSAFYPRWDEKHEPHLPAVPPTDISSYHHVISSHVTLKPPLETVAHKSWLKVYPCRSVSSALWFHNTVALQFGVGVNVFWRHLPADSYDKKDPYGNKDPVAATRALQALERALHTLDELPADYRDFYGRRMIQRIQKRTYCDTVTLPTSQFTKPGWGSGEY